MRLLGDLGQVQGASIDFAIATSWSTSAMATVRVGGAPSVTIPGRCGFRVPAGRSRAMCIAAGEAARRWADLARPGSRHWQRDRRKPMTQII